MLVSRRRFLSNLGAASLGAVSSHESNALLGFSPSGDRELRRRLAADPLRPQCHLLPAKNWMNDPNGPIHWKGQYHMFFQYNPSAAVWGDMHWAHAVSPDMIHWRHLPVALAPTPGSDDADGCFTGSAIDDNGTATILYTGVKSVPGELATLRDGDHNFREVQSLATSTDPQLRTWNKWKAPVLQPPDDPQLTGFRDPFLWRGADVWYMGVGSGIRRKGGRVLLYRSKNLREWDYLHPLASGTWTGRETTNLVDSGEMWECPDFFPLGSKHVLLYATAGQVAWEVGELDPNELVFHAERRGVLDHGAYYAQKTQLDAEGRRILWGWIPERRPEAEFSAAGWAGSMALPRVLSLNAQSDLEMRIAPQAETLRAKKLSTLAGTTSGEARDKSLALIEIKDGAFSMVISDSAGAWWWLNLENSASATLLEVCGKKIELPAQTTPELRFHLVLDASVAEFFCNSLHVQTSRIYRQPAGPLRVQISGESVARLGSLEAWQLRPISHDRLTT
jgi:beta-fructofuranosidase